MHFALSSFLVVFFCSICLLLPMAQGQDFMSMFGQGMRMFSGGGGQQQGGMGGGGLGPLSGLMGGGGQQGGGGMGGLGALMGGRWRRDERDGDKNRKENANVSVLSYFEDFKQQLPFLTLSVNIDFDNHTEWGRRSCNFSLARSLTNAPQLHGQRRSFSFTVSGFIY
jgi:hypothetical protein